MGAKVAAVRAWLDASNASAAVFASQAGFAWLTAGGHAHVAIGEAAGVARVLVSPEHAVVLTNNIERRRLLDEELDGTGLEVREWPWHEPEAAAVLIGELCDPGSAVSDLGVAGLPADARLATLRHRLLPAELDRYRRLGRDAADAVEAVCLAAEPGDSELDVAARLAFECRRRDILPLVVLVAADARIAAYRHPLPTDRPIRHTFLVALSGRRHGLNASLTRMVAFGEPDDDLRARHNAVTRVDAAMLLASRPGARLGSVLAAAIEQYAAEGFGDDWRLHHQGGLTGYAGREIVATPGEPHRLEPGQALAWNPSITRVKSEDTVVVGDGAPEILTRTGAWPEQMASVGAGAMARPALMVK